MVHAAMSQKKREWWATRTPEQRAEHLAKIQRGLEEGWKARGFWTDARVGQLRELWGTMPVNDICRAMGFNDTARPTYMMVIGKAHRLGLPAYPKPEKQEKPKPPPRQRREPERKLYDPWRGR